MVGATRRGLQRRGFAEQSRLRFSYLGAQNKKGTPIKASPLNNPKPPCYVAPPWSHTQSDTTKKHNRATPNLQKTLTFRVCGSPNTTMRTNNTAYPIPLASPPPSRFLESNFSLLPPNWPASRWKKTFPNQTYDTALHGGRIQKKTPWGWGRGERSSWYPKKQI